jgi:signal peptidase II
MDEPNENAEADEKAEQTADPPEEPKIPEADPLAGIPRLGTPDGAAAITPDVAPSYGFLVVVSLLTLVADLSTKVWAKEKLEQYPGYMNVWENHVQFILAHNKGGAWGLLQSTNENVRKPFFLLVSAAAIAFIVTLYRRIQPWQKALKWGLPLVLGGALGNVFDRIRYGSVVDFIDVHMEWKGEDHHWPTFNVADIAICVGVGLMAIDMFTSRRDKEAKAAKPKPPAPKAEEPAAARADAEEKAAPAPEAGADAGAGDEAVVKSEAGATGPADATGDAETKPEGDAPASV